MFLEMSSRVAIGIDLGTTNSCVGVVRNGRVEIIANDTGQRITPSCVAFTEEEILVGTSAKLQASWDPKNTVYEIKRLIGRKYEDPELKEKIEHWPFTIMCDAGNPKIEVKYKNQQLQYSPEEISAMVLSKMRKIAEDFIGHSVKDAVITVPANFKDSHRQATLDAGRIAGLNVLKLINEPTAAAIAYGVDRKVKDLRNVLVFDLGGGTFDVAILSIENGNFTVKAVTGDRFLGGADFDNILVDYLAEEFQRKTGTSIKENDIAIGKLRIASETAKCELSSMFKARIQIENVLPGQNFSTVVFRNRFEGLCADLFQKIIEPVAKVLKDSDLQKEQIHEIVLAGGSTRIPKIQKLLEEFLGGRTLNKTINADEAVAYGAAVQAAMMIGDRSVDKIFMNDIIPLSLGVRVAGDKMSTIIKKGTPIPTSNTKLFFLKYNQAGGYISVYEGENSDASDNDLLGKFSLDGTALKDDSKGVNVTFSVDENGVLHVTAKDNLTEAEGEITITATMGRLSKQEIDRMITDHEEYLEESRNKESGSSTANELEKYCMNMKGTVEKRMNKGKVLKKEGLKAIGACDATLLWIQNNHGASEADIQREKSRLEGILDDILE